MSQHGVRGGRTGREALPVIPRRRRVARTPMKTEHSDAGALFEADQLASLSQSLDVTRSQFSDMLPRFEAKRFRDFHFTAEDKEADGRWPVRSWRMGTARL